MPKILYPFQGYQCLKKIYPFQELSVVNFLKDTLFKDRLSQCMFSIFRPTGGKFWQPWSQITLMQPDVGQVCGLRRLQHGYQLRGDVWPGRDPDWDHNMDPKLGK